MDNWTKTEMQIDFDAYKDKFGLLSLRPGNGGNGNITQNGVLFTAEGILATKGVVDYAYNINSFFSMKACEAKPGLMFRHPESNEYDSMDNLSAMLSMCMLFKETALPTRIREHGLKVKCKGLVTENVSPIDVKAYKWLKILRLGLEPKNYWNNLQPEKFNFYSWFGRSPGMMGLLDLAATGKTTWFRALGLFVGQFLGCFADKGNTDARKLPYVVWQALRLRGGLWSLGYKIWVWKLFRDYPNGMKDVYSIYYGPTHPLTVWAPEALK